MGQAQYFIAAGGGSAEHDKSHILDIISQQSFDCSLEDQTNENSLLSVQGPKSRELLKRLTEADLSNEGITRTVSLGVVLHVKLILCFASRLAFPFSTNQRISVFGCKLLAIRLTFVGELGWELHLPNHSVQAVYKALFEFGKDLGIQDAGYRAIDVLSAEKGYRHWHSDLRFDSFVPVV